MTPENNCWHKIRKFEKLGFKVVRDSDQHAYYTNCIGWDVQFYKVKLSYENWEITGYLCPTSKWSLYLYDWKKGYAIIDNYKNFYDFFEIVKSITGLKETE